LNLNLNPENDLFYSNKITVEKIIKLENKKNEIEKIHLNNCERFKTKELLHMEKYIYENNYKKYNDNIYNIELFLAKNQYSEIENIAKKIIKLVRNENYRYKDISVITKQINTYSSLIRAIFKEYEIPVFIDEKRELSQNIVIQYILSVLEIFKTNWSYDSIINYLKTGFVNIDEDDIFNFENYCLKWGIKYNKWNKNFDIATVPEKDKPEVERLNEIRKNIVEPIKKLQDSMKKERTVKNICQEIYEFLLNQNFEKNLEEKILYLKNKGLEDLSNEYKASYKIIMDILDEMVLVFGDEKITFDKYLEIFKTGLKTSGLGKIPGTTDQVIVGDIERSRSHKVKAIFIIGLNDGIFPSNHREEGFLNDEDRKELKAFGIELAKGTIENLYEEKFNIYKAFSTAENKLFLSYSSTDSEGKALRPSIIISKIKKIFVKLIEESDLINSNYEILTKNTTYQELLYNINILNNGDKIENIWLDVYNYYKNKEEWKEKLKVNLKGLNYSNLPEQIKKENIEKLYGNVLTTSVSKLEKYRKCPFSYYLQYGLKLKEKDELKIQSINTGTFMHEIIDLFFNKVEQNGIQTKDITEEQIELIVSEIIQEMLKLNKNYIFISSEKYKLLVLRLKRIVIKAIKYIIETIKQSSFEIAGTEVEFGEKSKYKPIILNLNDGKVVEITGKIDRIDTAQNEDGKYIRIIDYKSSVKNIDLNDVYAGLQIQLVTYLDAVCKEEKALAAGILYFSLLEQMIKADKKMTTEEIENKIKSNFKMKGLLLADVKVVKMHDNKLTNGASQIVPAYIDKSGALSKKTNGITAEQFIDLQNYIYKTIRDISKEILSGKIDLKPYYKKGEKACKYCEYKGICGFKPGTCSNEYNYINSMTRDEILEKIKKEVK